MSTELDQDTAVAAACRPLIAGECPNLNLAGTDLAHIRFGGTDAWMVYQLDKHEHRRRRTAGLTAIERLDWLDLLMELPINMPVRRDTLSPASWRAVRRLPTGAVDITGDTVIRRIVQPLNPKIAIVAGVRWNAGLMRASRFAPYCNRVCALSGTPRDLTLAASTADLYGIGLIVNTRREPKMIVAPENYVQYRHTPAGWSFREAIYEQLDHER